jgi:hypothetical protein
VLPVSVIALACLPATLCLVLTARPQFFAVPTLLSARGRVTQLHGKLLVLTVLGCLLAVPLTLLAFADDAHIALAVGTAASFAGATWGAMRVCGSVNVNAALGASAAAVVAVLAFAGGGSAIWAANALSLCAGLGAAHLLHMAFSRKALIFFLAAFAALDIVVVASGLAVAAVHQLPLVGAFAATHSQALIFNRIQIGGVLLGSGDVAYAALVAALIVAAGVGRVRALGLCFCYALASIAFAAWATSSGSAMPATLPGAFVLVLLAVLVRRREPTALADNTLPLNV